MSAVRRLADHELAERMQGLAGWSVQAGRLHRELEFPTFAAAFAFLSEVALEAQALDHHPDLYNSYTRVTLDLVSHDVQGISERDFRLAARIDAVLARVSGG
jgi:4a-hydroxytetrahydrobiopterin dehydratase